MKWLRSRTAVVSLVAVVAVLTIALGAWQGWLAQAAGTTYVVNDVDPPEAECGTPDFTNTNLNTIIGVVSADDTLVLCEGTYDGGVVVNKKLTIEGQEAVDVDKIVVEVTAPGTDGIKLQADGSTVQHLFLEGPGDNNGILVDADDCTVSGVEARDWDVGVNVVAAQGTLVEESKLHDNALGVALSLGGPNVVRGSEITANTTAGLSLGMDEDQTVVERNLISLNDGTQALVTDLGFMTSGPVHVQFARNDIGTKAGADGIFINTIHGDSFVQISGSPDRVNNFSGPYDIVANDYYVELVCGAENTVDATYNWWGSTDRTDITNRIFNDADDPARSFTECPVAADQQRGGVVFEPWATAAWTPTPTPTPSPTPTPTPTPSPTPTPATRTFDLTPQGWHNFVWTGANDTPAETALSCIAGPPAEFAIAYQWTGPLTGWLRYVPDRCAEPGLCTLTTVDKYDSLLVMITASGVQCEMPVDPDP